MTDLRKAAQMALDWRDKNSELLFELGGWDFIFEINNWSQSIRGALAQPDLITHADVEQLARIEKLVEDVDPYTAPPQREWERLTDEEIKQLWKDTPQLVGVYSYTDIAREVEAKLKEKNGY